MSNGELLAISDEDIQNLMAQCPNSWQGDTGFQNWVKDVYWSGAASGAPAPAPVLTQLVPPSAKKNRDFALQVIGSGFDSATVKVIVGSSTLTPDSATTTLINVTVPAATIPNPGLVNVQAQNGDNQFSNTLQLNVTN